MKRVLIALLILASSAAFANTPGDPEVTVENWGFMTDGKVVSDLADNNGFTVPAYSFYGD